MYLKTDCRYILWDRPCRFHKETGVECPKCTHYAPRGRNILIVKLAAMGDVLRTTSILQGLKAKYPSSFITWVTMPASEELLLNNPYIDRILTRDLDILGIMQNEKFDLVLNPDTLPRSALLASMSKSKKKLGFIYKTGKVIPANKEAEYWCYMGMNDKLKKSNTKTYQEILLDMFKLPKDKFDIILKMPETDIQTKDNLIIGINTGAGGRWKLKSWPIYHTVALTKLIHEKVGAKILLLGGPQERERNKIIISKAEVPVTDTGTENPLMEFIKIVNQCDIVVVADSLALHIALGLSKKVVCLFGPTSSAEIELYGRGIHVVTPLDCSCCYKRTCEKKPNCMDTIKPEEVLQCIQKLL